jgi:hypothetical protein
MVGRRCSANAFDPAMKLFADRFEARAWKSRSCARKNTTIAANEQGHVVCCSRVSLVFQ